MDIDELVDCIAELEPNELEEAVESLKTGDIAASPGLLRLGAIIRSRDSQEAVKTYCDIDAVHGVFAQMGIDEELDYRERARDLADSVKNGGL